ncbi:hypothetical protein DBZ36_06065 [Alginatibacterium sediminis]|uniref:Uncharacterized protein n=1 Tax=Alginatibacterium sediminis TaxID=2164068 RepID=A0A420EH25_9ALTE|nr:hypothetical protein [Alginatibacterium sediminis]RKF20015.1 hypothetical protein DBZ36_06065 [Alginatibacterium sediminis]
MDINLNEQEIEYNKFGPWLMVIEDASQVPAQFLDVLDTIENADFSFKVPVKEERRNMAAGMLLYWQVVAVSKDSVSIFTIENELLSRKVFLFEDICYLEHGGDLLGSFICIASSREIVDVRYNLVSMEVASQAIELIRLGLRQNKRSHPSLDSPMGTLNEKQIYRYFRDKEKGVSKPTILGYQESRELAEPSPASLLNLYSSNKNSKLLDCMIMTDGTDLIIANRGKYILGIKDTNYKFGHVFIPFSKMTGVNEFAHEKYLQLKVLEIEIGRQSYEIIVDNNFSTSAIRHLVKRRIKTTTHDFDI